jgi:gas vesicle protein
LDDIYIKGLFGLVGIILGGVVTYFLRENKISLETRMKIIHESLDSMKNLLSSMSNTKNKVNLLISDIEKTKLIDTKIHKDTIDTIQECINNFNKNRGGLYIFIAKDESPLFIDYAVVLISVVSNITDYQDYLKHQEQIKKSYDTFKNLYTEYNNSYSRMLDIIINKKKFH